MFINPKYRENIVFQKNAVEELLTNIKKYPVRDIDYIEQDELDENGELIWNKYTDGTPCIKITYGDENTTKGNSIFAKTFAKAQRLSENKQKNLDKDFKVKSELATKWYKVWQANNDIYEKRKDYLTYYENLVSEDAKTELSVKILKELDKIWEQYNIEYDNLFNLYWEGNSENNGVTINPDNISTSPPRITKEDVTLINLQLEQENDIVITFPIIEIQSRDSLINILNTFKNSIDESETSLINNYNQIIEQVTIYPNYLTLGTGNFPAYTTQNDKIILSPESTTTPASIYNYIKNFLEFVIKSAAVKADNAWDIYKYYLRQIGNYETNKANLIKLYNDCQTCIDAIAAGTHIENENSSNVQILNSNNSTSIENWLQNIMDGTINISLTSDTIELQEGEENPNKSLLGIKYVKVGSNIKFINSTDGTAIQPTTASYQDQNNGSFRVTINSDTYEVPIKGLEESDANDLKASTNLLPNVNNYYNLGSSSAVWANAYINNLMPTTTTASTSGSTVGSATNPYVEGYFNKITVGNVTIGGSGGTGDSSKFLRGDGTWSNTLVGALNISNTNDGIKQGANGSNGFSSSYTGTYVGDTTASIYTTGGIYAAKNIIATRVFNAVFNDYAECRQTAMIAPGYVVIDQDDGTMIPSNERLQPGAQIVSDTYGHLMGMTEEARTPIAVAGRVLAYTYRPREEYHAGMAVCSAPGGTIDIMSREEIRDYPDCIIGIVSEIPDYEVWGSDNIKVNGRIWIKVR